MKIHKVQKSNLKKCNRKLTFFIRKIKSYKKKVETYYKTKET